MKKCVSYLKIIVVGDIVGGQSDYTKILRSKNYCWMDLAKSRIMFPDAVI